MFNTVSELTGWRWKAWWEKIGGEDEEVEPFKIKKCWLEGNKSETNHIQNWAHFTTASQNKASIRRGSWVENSEVAYKEEKS